MNWVKFLFDLGKEIFSFLSTIRIKRTNEKALREEKLRKAQSLLSAKDGAEVEKASDNIIADFTEHSDD